MKLFENKIVNGKEKRFILGIPEFKFVWWTIGIVIFLTTLYHLILI